ncbi:helicase domain-containing protein [Microvirga roseola]|uniref:hypothetical protein n=1 Tax=Microvirga roseola TaxID=2883126 RepID=UPI001E63E217|nr:hypothetical protein [Microvirga roseola]
MAGSGKTSVALGRLKFFANFRSGENAEEYGLRQEDWADFDASNMIGFVLSPSLVSYLQQTAESLELKGMKIQDFEEFLNRERNQRDIFSKPFKKSSENGHGEQKTITWLKALDIVVARYLADGILAIQAEPLLRPETNDGESITDSRWQDLVSTYWKKGTLPGRIRGLANGLTVKHSVDQKGFLIRGLARDIGQSVRLGDNEVGTLRIEERRALRDAVENVQLRMFRLLNPQEMFLQVFKDDAYRILLEDLCRQHQGSVADVVEPIRRRVSENKVTDDDIINALCLNALSCERFVRDIKAVRYLHAFAENVGVFIDEYQDFSELQVLLMGYKALSKYALVTVSGNSSQRLHKGGLAEITKAFPQISSPPRQILLDRNMRQTEPLARLSTCFRSLTDPTVAMPDSACRAPLAVYGQQQLFADATIAKILNLPEAASVAVICPNQDEVERFDAGRVGGGLSESNDLRQGEAHDALPHTFHHSPRGEGPRVPCCRRTRPFHL